MTYEAIEPGTKRKKLDGLYLFHVVIHSVCIHLIK